jgi:OCT family organic cation transporter-like MFS transporter 4/5
MDEAVETVITGTKYQNIQTIIAIIFSGLNSLFFYLIPFLFKQPILFNNNKSTSIKNNTNSTSINNYTLDEICSSNNINSFIDYDNSFNNYSLILKLFCNNNIFEFEIIIFIYYISKGINSIVLGYFTDKFGRFFILFYGSVLTIVSFIFLFLGINNYFFLFLGSILIGACSYFYIFSSILTCEFFTRNQSATVSSLNVIAGPILAIFFIFLLKIFNNMNFIFLILIICSIITFFYIKKYFNESLYYLISRNRINECFTLLETFAELNERQNLYDKINQERYGTDKLKPITFTANILDVYNYNSQRKRLIMHILIWIFSSISFHGLFDLLSFFRPIDNFTINYIIIFVIFIITQLAMGILSDNIGRQQCIIYSFYISAISYIIFALTEEKIGIKKFFFYISTAASSSTFSLLFIFSAEDFPTCIRGTVLGFLFGLSQFIALIGYYIKSELVLCLFMSFSNCIGGRIVESMEDTFDLLLDDNVPESNINDNTLKKKKYRSLKCERKSSGSDLYFLTSDDEVFNKEAETQYV